jgi:hypothetical protein
MTDTERLRDAIRNRGLKIGWIAEQMGLAPWSFTRKMNNVSEFTSREIMLCSQLIGLTFTERDRIFFARDVEAVSTKEK